MRSRITNRGLTLRVLFSTHRVYPKITWQVGSNATFIRDRKEHLRWSFMILAIVSLLFLMLSGQPIRAEENGFPKVVRIGYSLKIFPDVDIRDAQVAMDLWSREINRIVQANVFPKSVIFQDIPSMLEAIRKQEIDMLNLASLDYLRIKNKSNIEPLFVTANQVGNGQERVLIVRKDRGLAKISHLKDTILNVQSRLRDEISLLWLNTLLARNGSMEAEKFFRQVREVSKASQAVLPVFFGQVDSAVVSRSGMEMTSVLNPQLNEDLSILASSKNLVGYISCINKSFDESLKRLMIEKAPKMHESPSGKQMFILVQVDRVIPFKPSYLDNLIELEREHRMLSGGSIARSE
jgi:ABC-type phosphate/phosphonate transport system substrate-binding protein